MVYFVLFDISPQCACLHSNFLETFILINAKNSISGGCKGPGGTDPGQFIYV